MTTALLHRALVAGTRRINDYLVITLESPEIARAVRPGQFVTVPSGEGSEHLLRRPFSVYRAFPEEGLIELAFDVIGPGTRWLASQKPCFDIDVNGPLGVGFTLPAPGTPCTLVGGGYGTSALYELAVALRANGNETHLIAGAARASRVFAPDPSLFDRVTITTEDGSEGVRGRVTDVMTPEGAVFACGPMAMLAAVSRTSIAAGRPVQIATEEFMACGSGVCWTCVVPVQTAEGLRNLRCCTEGPVFDGAAVEWR